MPKKFDSILFDLDGTLLDTARDLANALNKQLQHHGKPPLPFDELRELAAQGSVGLLERGFGIAPSHPKFTHYRNEYLACYEQTLAVDTVLFPGMAQVLEHIEQHNIPWGIVTNKPARFAFPLLEQLNLHKRAAVIVAGDTTGKEKPDPLPIVHACKLINQPPENCLYIGDAETDVIACRAINMPIAIALWGYIHAHENPLNWQADYWLETAIEIVQRVVDF